MKINEKNITTQHQKKDLKDLLTFAYLSIDYKATETNKHFYISFVNIASGKIYKNIDWLQIIKHQWKTRDRDKRKRKKQKPQAPDIEKCLFFYFPIFIGSNKNKRQRQEKEKAKETETTSPRHWKVIIFVFSLFSIKIDLLQGIIIC